MADTKTTAPVGKGYRLTNGRTHQHFKELGGGISYSNADIANPKVVEVLQKAFTRTYGAKDGAARLAQLIEPNV